MTLLLVAMLGTLLPPMSHAVTQPQWNAMPAACLPSRAVPWNDSVPEDSQADCSCPPNSMCPSINVSTMQDFFANTRMPSWLILRCNCPLPTCAAGTHFEGLPLPDDGECNCPLGTDPSRIDSTRVPLNQRCISPPPPEPPVDTGGGGDSGAGGGDGGDCLRSDSLVEVADGTRKPVAEIVLGDRLKGPDGDAEVVAINQLQDRVLFYRINNLQFAITGDHPIRTTEGWKSVDDIRKFPETIVGRLEVGDTLITQQGEVKVTSIEVEPPKQGTRSINIRTADGRPFFVDGVEIKPFKDILFTY
jgi:hypothetical protein